MVRCSGACQARPGSQCCVPRSILSYYRRSSGPRISPQPHVLLPPAMDWVCHTWRTSRSRNETVLSLTLGLTTSACPDHSVHSCLASPGSWPSGTATSSGIVTSRFLHGDTHISVYNQWGLSPSNNKLYLNLENIRNIDTSLNIGNRPAGLNLPHNVC